MSEIHNFIHCFKVIFNDNSRGINNRANQNQIVHLGKVTLTSGFFWLHTGCYIYHYGCLLTDSIIPYTMQIPVDLQSSIPEPILIINTIAYAYLQTILCIQNTSSHADIKQLFESFLIIVLLSFILAF